MLDQALRFAGDIVLELLLSAWTFLPTILAMSKGGPALALGPLLKTNLKSLIRGFIPGMWINGESTPQSYCSVIMMLLAVSLLFNRADSIKTRIATLVVTTILATSPVLSTLEYIWCSMRVPNGFYSRTAFLLSFFTLWAAVRSLAGAGHRTAQLPWIQQRGRVSDPLCRADPDRRRAAGGQVRHHRASARGIRDNVEAKRHDKRRAREPLCAKPWYRSIQRHSRLRAEGREPLRKAG